MTTPTPSNREPVLTVGSITALITAGFALLVSFGMHISDDKQSAILGVVAVLVPLVTAVVARRKVTPVP